MAPWSIPTNCTSIHGTARFADSANNFHGKFLAQIGKGSDQYLPEFLTPDEIERFGKELDEYRSELSEKNISEGPTVSESARTFSAHS